MTARAWRWARSGSAGPRSIAQRCAGWIGLGAAFAVVIVGKELYRDASAAALGFVLAPIAHAVAVVTRTPFHATPAGWLDARGTFLIAPACAGVNFALAAFLALCLMWRARFTSAAAVAGRLALAAAVAYGATLVVNTVRIAVAVEMHRAAWDGGDAHELEGIAVYLAGLCALTALVRAIEHRRSHALAA